MDKAFEAYHSSLAVSLPILGENHPDLAKTFNSMGNAYVEKGDYNKALEYFRRVLSNIVTNHGDQYPRMAFTYSGVGKCLAMQGTRVQSGQRPYRHIGRVTRFSPVYEGPSVS